MYVAGRDKRESILAKIYLNILKIEGATIISLRISRMAKNA